MPIMKQLLITIAAVVLVGCGESQQSATAPEAKPESATVKAPDISIHEAAGVGNIEAIKQHIAAGTDINAKSNTKSQYTPLHMAAFRGHKEVAELLIAKGADVNAKSEDGTPLDCDIEVGVAFGNEVADLLRKHGGKTAEELKAEDK